MSRCYAIARLFRPELLMTCDSVSSLILAQLLYVACAHLSRSGQTGAPALSEPPPEQLTMTRLNRWLPLVGALSLLTGCGMVSLDLLGLSRTLSGTQLIAAVNQTEFQAESRAQAQAGQSLIPQMPRMRHPGPRGF